VKKIAVIGTGYVGLVSGTGLADFGNEVTCLDIDDEKIEILQNGELPIWEPGLLELVKKNVQSDRLSFSTNIPREIQDAEVIFIAVGTPSAENGEADLSAVYSVARTIGQNLNGHKFIVTKSTVPVGTGKKVRAIIEEEAAPGSSFEVISNPEFLREGSAVYDFMHPDRVVVGTETEDGHGVMQDIYRPLYLIETPFVFTNVPTAELIKYASNAFLATKITFINEIANICDGVGADVHMVAKTMGMDGRISPKFLHPGPGYGGSCFPKDVKALSAIARDVGYDARLIDAVTRVNESQKMRMFSKLQKMMPELEGKTVTLLGLAFKQRTDDVRESPALPIIDKLKESGAMIRAFDPVAMESMKKRHPNLEYFDDIYESVRGADAVMILTEWNEFRGLDLQRMKSLMREPNMVDARNLYDPDTVRKTGFKYACVGRETYSEKLA